MSDLVWYTHMAETWRRILRRGEQLDAPWSRPSSERSVVLTYEAETWRRMLDRGEPADAANGMLVAVVERASGDVQRLMRVDGEWLSQ